MAIKQFKAESKRLLDLMINSIYTHKEIFLRELISNANDALDKLHFMSLTNSKLRSDNEELSIVISADKEKRTLTIKDNGCGMTKEELENNLGTIAKSGTLAFKNEHKDSPDLDVIGQFGVGFYSAFMVSEKITVTTKAAGGSEAFVWESSGVEGYTVRAGEKDKEGTIIELLLKPNTEDDIFDDYLNEYTIQGLVKKYSDYIRYPIKMMMETSKLKEGSDSDFETVRELTTLNSRIPIWKMPKNKVKEDDYNDFYRTKFGDYSNPAKVISTKTEGALTYSALLFVPSEPPYNYYSKDFVKGLQLYSNGVLIMDKCAELLPDYFAFLKGVVDSSDLSLNISREMLQHDRQLNAIRLSLEKKVKAELIKMCADEREKYVDFFKKFGRSIKFGIYDRFGANKDNLVDLILLYSSSEKKMVTLKEYIDRIKKDQKFIYYATGETNEKIDKLPQTELVKDKDYEILYLTDEVDEFCIKILEKYEGKEFKSVSSKDLGLETEDEKKQNKKETDENKDMFEFIKKSLKGKVNAVKLSTRLKNHAVCLTAEGEVSLEMEKVLNAMPNAKHIKAARVLEINPNHKIFEKLKGLYASDKDTLNKYSEILYNQALLIEGLPIDDPVAFSNLLCEILV